MTSAPTIKNEDELYAVGILNFSPTTMRSVARLFADLMAFTVIPCVLAMKVSVSPDLTR